MSIEPDTKDWTWVVDQPCPDCGFDPATVEREKLPDLIHESVRDLVPPAARRRLRRTSRAARVVPLEYACHVRDVHRIFAERVRRMLEEDNPEFDNWDQDEAAVEQEYSLLDPAEVGTELVERGAEAAAAYASVPEDGWQRTGRRKPGRTGPARSARRSSPSRASAATTCTTSCTTCGT